MSWAKLPARARPARSTWHRVLGTASALRLGQARSSGPLPAPRPRRLLRRGRRRWMPRDGHTRPSRAPAPAMVQPAAPSTRTVLAPPRSDTHHEGSGGWRRRSLPCSRAGPAEPPRAQRGSDQATLGGAAPGTGSVGPSQFGPGRAGPVPSRPVPRPRRLPHTASVTTATSSRAAIGEFNAGQQPMGRRPGPRLANGGGRRAWRRVTRRAGGAGLAERAAGPPPWRPRGRAGAPGGAAPRGECGARGRRGPGPPRRADGGAAGGGQAGGRRGRRGGGPCWGIGVEEPCLGRPRGRSAANSPRPRSCPERGGAARRGPAGRGAATRPLPRALRGSERSAELGPAGVRGRAVCAGCAPRRELRAPRSRGGQGQWASPCPQRRTAPGAGPGGDAAGGAKDGGVSGAAGVSRPCRALRARCARTGRPRGPAPVQVCPGVPGFSCLPWVPVASRGPPTPVPSRCSLPGI